VNKQNYFVVAALLVLWQGGKRVRGSVNVMLPLLAHHLSISSNNRREKAEQVRKRKTLFVLEQLIPCLPWVIEKRQFALSLFTDSLLKI